jgi:hypothetical protein
MSQSCVRGGLPGGDRRSLGESFGDRLVGDLAVPDVKPAREAGVSASGVV